jgi:hypothetical protein
MKLDRHRRALVRLFGVGLFLLLARSVSAGSIELFRATVSGEDAWHGEDAKVRFKLGRLEFAEHGKRNASGGVLLNRNLPFLGKGMLEVDVKQVRAGSYQVEILAFKNGGHIATLEAGAGEREGVRFRLSVDGAVPPPGGMDMEGRPIDVVLPPETDEIGLRVRVGGMRGASTKFNDIVYKALFDDSLVLLRVEGEAFPDWDPDHLVVSEQDGVAAGEPADTSTFGSLLSSQRIDRGSFDRMVLQLSEVAPGAGVSVQFVAFDHEGTYAGSIDVAKNLPAGTYVFKAGNVPWFPRAEQFQVKLWVGGGIDAVAHVERLLVLKKAALIDDEKAAGRENGGGS